MIYMQILPVRFFSSFREPRFVSLEIDLILMKSLDSKSYTFVFFLFMVTQEVFPALRLLYPELRPMLLHRRKQMRETWNLMTRKSRIC